MLKFPGSEINSAKGHGRAPRPLHAFVTLADDCKYLLMIIVLQNLKGLGVHLMGMESMPQYVNHAENSKRWRLLEKKDVPGHGLSEFGLGQHRAMHF